MLICGVPLDNILLFFTSGTQVVMIALTLINTLSNTKGIIPILHLIPLSLLGCSLFFWLQTEFILSHAPIVLIVHGLIFAKFSWILIVCSAAEMDFDWLHLDIIIELAFVLEHLYIKMLPTKLGFILFCAFIGLRFYLFVTSIIGQLTSFLKIRVFSMNK